MARAGRTARVRAREPDAGGLLSRYVSAKTASVHVSNILRKLEVANPRGSRSGGTPPRPRTLARLNHRSRAGPRATREVTASALDYGHGAEGQGQTAAERGTRWSG